MEIFIINSIYFPEYKSNNCFIKYKRLKKEKIIT